MNSAARRSIETIIVEYPKEIQGAITKLIAETLSSQLEERSGFFTITPTHGNLVKEATDYMLGVFKVAQYRPRNILEVGHPTIIFLV